MEFRKVLLILCVFVMAISMTGCQKTEVTKINASINASIEQNNNLQDNSTSPEYLSGFTYINNPVRVQHSTFSIVKPADWTENTYKNSLVYMAPGTDFNDTFSEKVSMMIGIVPDNDTRTLEQITNKAISDTQNSNPYLQVVERGTATLGQIDAIKVVFSTPVDNGTLALTQLRARQGNRLYVFSIQCGGAVCADEEIFNEMAKSFEWKNP